MSGDALADDLLELLIAQLQGDTRLGGVAHAIGRAGDTGPVPAISIIDALSTPWGSKDRPGAELRLELLCRDRGDEARLTAMADAVNSVVSAMPRTGDGWQSGAWLVVRRRSIQRRDGERRVALSIRVRGWRTS